MARIHLTLWYSYALFAVCAFNLRGSFVVANEERKDYIVYMGALPSNPNYSPNAHHLSMLQEVVNRSYVGQSLIRSYKRSFNGFTAHLTEEEAKTLSANEQVASIFPSKILPLQTTESWDFMGLTQTIHRDISVEGDIIIGVLDTGIWPESKSFSDHGFGPIPKKWKGVCDGGKNFTCNKKIIGARYYKEDSCRDIVGHGSHVASIAAGNKVQNASFYGIVEGTARGGVPSARIAVYKTCTKKGCSDISILAGFDDAIADGVDILSVSIGSFIPFGLEQDPVAIGSFHATMKNILTIQSAGNDGPNLGTVSSNAPWLFTVAASTTNRTIISKVVLGNGTILVGNSVNSFELNGTQFPVVYGVDASTTCDENSAKACDSGCLDEDLVKGKIVFCNKPRGIGEGRQKGALGLLWLAKNFQKVSYVFPYTISVLFDEQQIDMAERYYKSTKSPKMNILKSETRIDLNAPMVAGFSSRGPNPMIPDILKPDITAPGIEILAAYSPASSPSEYDDLDKRSVNYNILFGTSFSCPHVTGAAAYVKSLHPNWSSSAIKSALMTTAWPMNATKATYGGDEFSYGAGHLDPVKAVNPGILYETSQKNYIKFMCSLMNISSSSIIIKSFDDYNITCRDVSGIKPKDLNYPSMAANIEDVEEFKVRFSRKVTNVGLSNSTYKAKITCNHSPCNITVVPNILSFKSLNEKKSFVVTVAGTKIKNMISASLEWNDGIHVARSPIVVYSRKMYK